MCFFVERLPKMAGEQSRESHLEVESRRFRVERPVKVEVESFCLEHEPAFRVERSEKVEVESFCLEHEPAFPRGALGEIEG